MANTYYTTAGSVRGCCGHKHRTLETAEACRERDQQGCVSQGGYSDRLIAKYIDGERQDLDESEIGWLFSDR